MREEARLRRRSLTSWRLRWQGESKGKSAKAAERASAQTAKAAQETAKAAKIGWLAGLLRCSAGEKLRWRPGVNATDVHAMLCCTHRQLNFSPKLLELDFT